MSASVAQEQFWVVDELVPGTDLLNMLYGYRIKGSFDVIVLRRRLEEIVNRYEVLRTFFTEIDGRFVQIVDKKLRVKLRVTDLSRLPGSRREKQATQLSRQDASAGFDLEKGLLLRTKLIRLIENEHI